MSVLMATHDAELVRRNPKVRVLELERGRLVYDSETDPAFSAPDLAGPPGPATPPARSPLEPAGSGPSVPGAVPSKDPDASRVSPAAEPAGSEALEPGPVPEEAP